MKKRFSYSFTAIAMVLTLAMTGCGHSSDSGKDGIKSEAAQKKEEKATETAAKVEINTDDMFTERDLSGEYDNASAVNIDLADNKSSSSSENVEINENTVTIKSEGVYILSGSLSDGRIVVDAGDSDKIQLVLNGVNVTSKTSAALYVASANKVFVTLAGDSDNTLSNGGTYEAVDDNNIDGTVFAKDDITFNGAGKLVVNSAAGHGIVAKDDLVIASGDYSIVSDSESHAIQAKNSVRIAGGNIELKAGKDGIHAENSDDQTVGYIYIKDCELAIEAGSDGISAATTLQIDGGNIAVSKCKEGLEAKDITINDGNIDITADDDGINASDGSGDDMDGMPKWDKDGERPERPDGDMPERPNGDRPERPDKSGKDKESANDKNSAEDTSGESDDNSSGKSGRRGRPDIKPEDLPDGVELPEGVEPPGDMPAGGKDGVNVPPNAIQDVTLVINGGNITINSQGDGIDSNGTLTINGGTIYVFGSSNGGNGAIDSGKDAVINGGTILAVGDSSMAEGFSEESGQASIMTTVDDQSEGGTIILKDSSGKELIKSETAKRYNSVVVSCPEMKKGETYTLVTGDGSKEVTVE